MLYYIALALLVAPFHQCFFSPPTHHFSTGSENNVRRCAAPTSRLNREESTAVWAQNLTRGRGGAGVCALIIGSARITPPETCTCCDRNAFRAFSTTMPGARKYDVARSNGPLFASLNLHSRGRYLLRLVRRGRGSRSHRRNRLDRLAFLGPTVNRPRGENSLSPSLSRCSLRRLKIASSSSLYSLSGSRSTHTDLTAATKEERS